MPNFFNKYPYTDFHELNLDWLIARMKELQIQFDEFKVVNNITFSGQWDITKQYPAWTIVNDNNIGYVSIQPVPVGVVLTNADYWVEVIDYSAQIAGMNNRIIALENDMLIVQSDITGLIKKTSYVTPEDFGAVGDGISDDTQAIKDALASHQPVLGFNDYLISDTIEFDTTLNYSIVKFFGKITYTGSDACFTLTSKYVDLFINDIEGDGNNIAISFERISSSNTIAAHNILKVNHIDNFNVGIRCKTIGTNGVQYNNIIFNEILNCTYGIKNELNSGWVNSNYFTGGRIGPVSYAIYTDISAGEFDGNMFNNIGIEVVTQRSIVLNKSTSNYFKGLRMAEGFTGDYLIYMTDSSKNYFEGDINVAINQIYDSVTTPSPSTAHLFTNKYKCKMITNIPNGSWLDTEMESYNNTFLVPNLKNQALRGDLVDIDLTSPGSYYSSSFRLLLGGSHTVKLPYLFEKIKINTNPIGAYTLKTSDDTTLTIDLTTGGNNRIFQKIGDKYTSIILSSTV